MLTLIFMPAFNPVVKIIEYVVSYLSIFYENQEDKSNDRNNVEMILTDIN